MGSARTPDARPSRSRLDPLDGVPQSCRARDEPGACSDRWRVPRSTSSSPFGTPTATIQAQWQTNVRNTSRGRLAGLHDGAYAGAAGLEGRFGRFSWNPALRAFMRAQDIQYILDTWGRYLPPDRIHVITVPSGCGQDAALGAVRRRRRSRPRQSAQTLPNQANESLGYASTELIRRLNMELGRLPHTAYNPTILDYLAMRVLARRRDQEAHRAPGPSDLRVRARLEPTASGRRSSTQTSTSSATSTNCRSSTSSSRSETDEDQAPPSDDELLAAASRRQKRRCAG